MTGSHWWEISIDTFAFSTLVCVENSSEEGGVLVVVDFNVYNT